MCCMPSRTSWRSFPTWLRTRGEACRLGLEAIARQNKLENNVVFYNRFVELKELTEFIGAADSLRYSLPGTRPRVPRGH
jgi:hypothetical protein